MLLTIDEAVERVSAELGEAVRHRRNMRSFFKQTSSSEVRKLLLRARQHVNALQERERAITVMQAAEWNDPAERKVYWPWPESTSTLSNN